ncbi:type III secretion protein [Rhodobacterales bacterium HKCCE2091]|nr:type III secretion protein [Rhodobacterales bacterium HKCCE2091]
MIGELAELLDLSQAWLTAGIAVFLRVGAAFAVMPAIGESFIPQRIKLAAALAFTFILTPAVAPDLLPMDGTLPPLRFFLTETVSGLVIGIGLRLIVIALQVAGSMAAQATSLSQIMGGASPDPQPALGGILLVSGLALAVASGLHVHLVRTFITSYDVLPAGVFPLARDTGLWGVQRVSATFSLAFSLAAPFLIASLLYNLMLGVISKAMPQLMVALVGAPAITWGSLVLLLLTLPFLLPIWLRVFQTGLAHSLGGL